MLSDVINHWVVLLYTTGAIVVDISVSLCNVWWSSDDGLWYFCGTLVHDYGLSSHVHCG
jgi:hypothetical protein